MRHGTLWSPRGLVVLVAIVLSALASCGSNAHASTVGTITEYTAGLAAHSKPGYIAVGPDGSAWFTDFGAEAVGHVTTAGVITEFKPKATGPPLCCGILKGADGNMWFADRQADSIDRITPEGAITEYFSGIEPCPGAIRTCLGPLVQGPEGNLWFTSINPAEIGRITPTGSITEFHTGLPSNSQPSDLIASPDGDLWFADSSSGAVGKITPSGTISEFSSGLKAGSEPWEIAGASDGGVWFSDRAHQDVIYHATTTGEVTETSAGLTPTSSIFDLTSGVGGNVWFADPANKAIGRITPAGEIREFPTGLKASDLVVGPDGNMWYLASEPENQAIGRITPSGEVSEFNSGLAHKGSLEYLAAGPDSLWFTDTGETPAIGRIVAIEQNTPVILGEGSSGLHTLRISHAHESAAKWREGRLLAQISRSGRAKTGTTFSFNLSDSATVHLAFTQIHAGHRNDRYCLRLPRLTRREPSCLRTVHAATLVVSGKPGTNRIRFDGRLSRTKSLTTGAYTVTITGSNSTGRSNAVRLRFTILG